MTNEETGQGIFNRKIVLILMVLGLGAIFVSSFVYRADKPSLTIQNAPRGGMSGDPMNGIMELMARMRENPNDVRVLVTLGEQFMRIQSWDKALALLNRALVVEPSNIGIIQRLGMCLINMGKYAEAAEHYKMILGLDEKNAQAHYNLGILYKRFLKDENKAKEHFQAVLDQKDVPPDLRKMAQDEIETQPKAPAK
ncbi:MAG: tetratricopeptide repeat protein [Thermodesulfobacteriota bacterium]|nr:tetratricopeptide repeat protein [Thermodesulfobacteriota bacterium]